MSDYECDNDNHPVGCRCPGHQRADDWAKALMLREDEIESFRTWYESTFVQYGGMISRQALVTFCQNKVVEIMKDSEYFYAAGNSATLVNQERLEMLREYSSCLGEVRALRKVCEWAREQKTDGSKS